MAKKDGKALCAAFLEADMGLLYRAAASYEGDPERRRDLLQDMVLAIWTAAPRFAGRSAFRTYALRIAHNRAVSHVAQAVREPSHVPLDGAPAPAEGDPARVAGLEERQERLLAAVRGLPLGQRQVLALALEGMTYAEIADITGISVSNVGVRLNRARRSLEARLGGG